MDAIATRTLVGILCSQGRRREALAMARELLRSSPDDTWLRHTVTNIEESMRARDPLRGLTAEGRARVRARFEVFISRIRARRRPHPGVPPPAAEPAPTPKDLGITLPEIAVSRPEDDDLPLVLEEVTSGIVSPEVAYAAVEAVPPAETPAAAGTEDAPRPAPALQLRGRKLRLLEALMDRVERRRRAPAG
ncbi:MAG: hypothetical protein HY897_09650 [Deltaproteobacteria bacterium]|nr:hypothetical protein [Deltaproteobacteria bacterium]